MGKNLWKQGRRVGERRKRGENVAASAEGKSVQSFGGQKLHHLGPKNVVDKPQKDQHVRHEFFVLGLAHHFGNLGCRFGRTQDGVHERQSVPSSERRFSDAQKRTCQQPRQHRRNLSSHFGRTQLRQESQRAHQHVFVRVFESGHQRVAQQKELGHGVASRVRKRRVFEKQVGHAQNAGTFAVETVFEHVQQKGFCVGS